LRFRHGRRPQATRARAARKEMTCHPAGAVPAMPLASKCEKSPRQPTHHLRKAPAECGRGQPSGWPHRAAQPSRLPQMVHVGLSGLAFGELRISLIHRFPVSTPALARTKRCGPPRERAAEKSLLFTSPSVRSRIIHHSKRRAFTSHLLTGGGPLQCQRKAVSNTARPQRPPRPFCGLCAAGQLLVDIYPSPSFRFAVSSA
jgi:hypothetical protein